MTLKIFKLLFFENMFAQFFICSISRRELAFENAKERKRLWKGGESLGKFHQRFTRAFFIRKSFF
jgi:hypothetical protein